MAGANQPINSFLGGKGLRHPTRNEWMGWFAQILTLWLRARQVNPEKIGLNWTGATASGNHVCNHSKSQFMCPVGLHVGHYRTQLIGALELEGPIAKWRSGAEKPIECSCLGKMNMKCSPSPKYILGGRPTERETHQEICGLPTAYRIGFINQYKRLLPRKVWPKCTYRNDTWKGTWVV